MTQYPFKFNAQGHTVERNGDEVTVKYKHVRGKVPSAGASQLRALVNEGRADPEKIVAMACSYDGLSSRQIEQMGYPCMFLSGYATAGSMGLPDAGYIAFEDLVQRIQQITRVIDVPLLADGDTGYGGLASVYRTVQGFANAGAAGVMIEDQKWPKKCGHTRGKEIVDREEAYARIRAAVGARENGKDIFILARTDALMVSVEEAFERAREFTRLGADAIFMEAMPDRSIMERAVKEIDNAIFANIIEGGKTELVGAKDMAKIGIAAATYPLTALTARISATREAIGSLTQSFHDNASPETILPFSDVCEEIGFEKYWEIENGYAK